MSIVQLNIFLQEDNNCTAMFADFLSLDAKQI
jgi:hypothetical protein